MKSTPKAIALGVVILEIIICFLIYVGCACFRRWREHHHPERQPSSHRKSSKVFSDESDNNKVSGPALESVLVFFSYSVAKALLGNKVTSLRCTNCLIEFNDEDETLRLIPMCGHVFHPMCLVDPCSAICSCCRATGPELDRVELDESKGDNDDEVEVEVEDKAEIEVDMVDEEVLKIVVEEKKFTRLPEDLRMKIIIHAKVVSPTGKFCRPTQFIRK